MDVAAAPKTSKIAFRPIPDTRGPHTADIAGFIIAPSAQCHIPLACDHIIESKPIHVPMVCVVAVVASIVLQMTFISHTP